MAEEREPAIEIQEGNEEEEERLRYLSFVPTAAAQAAVIAASLYSKAKASSGPFCPSLEGVEETVKIVAAPVCDKLHAVPLDCLRFLDRKVGESVEELDRHVPEAVKKTPAMALSAAAHVQQAGILGAATELARSAIAKVEPVAERKAAEAWRSLNKLPVFPAVARTVVPVAAGLSEWYNEAVSESAEQGHAVAAHLPLIRTERIARVFADPPVLEMEPIQPQ